MEKRDLSEEDIKAQYITPAIEKAGWNIKKQVRMEYPFTAGRIILRGNVTSRGKKKRADYLLFYKTNIPLAIVEAKDNNYAPGQACSRRLIMRTYSILNMCMPLTGMNLWNRI